MNPNLVLMTIVFFAVFYVFFIRPENIRKKRAEEMRNSVRKGERITTIGGMKGRVIQITDDSVIFETSEDRVRIEVARWGIQSTESMEAEMAQQRPGLFGKKAETSPKEKKADEEKTGSNSELD